MVLRAVAAAFVVLVSQGPTLKSPNVDFSGSWTLVENGKLGALGKSVKLTQTPTTLTVEGPDGAATYTLNGETRKTFPAPSDLIARDPETTMWTYVTTRVSVSGWTGNQLVIVNHQFNRANFPGASPREFDAEWTHQLKLSLDDDGRLVVERDAINDPLPLTMNVGPAMLKAFDPYAKKSVYEKRK